jgi:hypothetical protein
MTQKNYLLALIRSPRASFIEGMNKQENETMTIHFDYLKGLMMEVKLFIV